MAAWVRCSSLQLLVLLFAAASLVGFLTTTYMSHLLLPEIGMVVSSQCVNPLRDWDGKFMRIPVTRNFIKDRREAVAEHSRAAAVGVSDDPRLQAKALAAHRNNASAATPIIFWGAHHKAGTYLAQKIFSYVCARRGWCCVFGQTRDSAASMVHALGTEPVRVMGHNQWVWLPQEFGVSYRFVHFYRHPYRKIISGYRYHRDGSENWCRNPQRFSQACAAPDASALNTEAVPETEVSRFCSASHLCQACCRREHESNDLSAGYALRPANEYSFLCRHLGALGNESLTDALLRLNAREGVIAEAALDYYEALRMARLVNLTWSDPHTLNVDIDSVQGNFLAVVTAILRHIDPGAVDTAGLAEQLQFFDYDSSALYRWSVSNPVFRHVDSRTDPAHETGKQELFAELERDEHTRRLYAPILELMHSALRPLEH